MESSPHERAENRGSFQRSSSPQYYNEPTTCPSRSRGGANNQPVARTPWRKQFARARNRLVDHRARISRLRVGLQEKRVGLRQLRRKASKLDASFITALRRLWARQIASEAQSLFELYEKVQEIRDAIGPEEDDYDQEEDDMTAAEYSLEEEEHHVYHSFLTAPFEDDTATPSPPPSPGDTAMEEDPPLPDTNDPLFQYESRIGDANILRERLDELVFEYEQYTEEKQRREPFGLQLYEPYLEFLQNFDKTYHETATELQQTENDIESLKQIAIDKGLLHEPETSQAIPASQEARVEAPEQPLFPNTSASPARGQSTAGQSASISRTLSLIQSWLSDIRFPVEQVLRTARMSFSVRDTEGLTRLVRKYCATYFTVLGSREEQLYIQGPEQQPLDSGGSDYVNPLQDDREDLEIEARQTFSPGSGYGDSQSITPNMKFSNYWDPGVETPTSLEEAEMTISLQRGETLKDISKFEFDSQSV